MRYFSVYNAMVCLYYTSETIKNVVHLSQASNVAYNTNTTKRDILLLHNSLSHHCMGYFHETCNVCSFYIIYVTISFCSVFHTLFMNIMHDLM